MLKCLSLKWHFCTAMLIISEDVLITGPTDEAGRKEVCNYDWCPFTIWLNSSHSTNYLFVPIICFAELVRPRVHLDSKSDFCEEHFTVYFFQAHRLCFWARVSVCSFKNFDHRHQIMYQFTTKVKFSVYCFTKIYEAVKSVGTIVAGRKQKLPIVNTVLAKLAQASPNQLT